MYTVEEGGYNRNHKFSSVFFVLLAFDVMYVFEIE